MSSVAFDSSKLLTAASVYFSTRLDEKVLVKQEVTAKLINALNNCDALMLIKRYRRGVSYS